MRRIIPISLFVLLLALLLPLLVIYTPELPEPDTPDLPDAYPAGLPLPTPEAPPGPEGPLDAELTLQVLLENGVHEMTMMDFLQGVVAAEMPAQFHEEALKAQAVAARTYTLHRKLVTPTPRHPEADVCGDYACCKAFHSVDRLQERWGEGFEYYRARIAQAVGETDGVILLYDDQPILAAFHAASYGHTEASAAIWGTVPYLQSVPTHEGENDVPRFYDSVEMTFSQFRSTALEHLPEAVLDYGRIPYWISDITYTDAGRLDRLTIGGVVVAGAEFRRMFSLRSTAIQFTFSAETMTITTGGHGHGVGMSQFGANAMATEGHTYEEILNWYYTDVVLSRVSALFPQ